MLPDGVPSEATLYRRTFDAAQAHDKIAAYREIKPQKVGGKGSAVCRIKETMMSAQENKQLAMRGYERFMKGDIQGVLDICDDDVEWTSAELMAVPFSGAFHGKNGVADFFRKMAESVEFLAFQPESFIADGDQVAVTGHSTTRVRSTGATFDDNWVHIFTMKNGKTTRFEQHHNSAAIAAAFMPMGAAQGAAQPSARH